jgi:RNA polymerase sigma-70 factor (ECF subfamily)
MMMRIDPIAPDHPAPDAAVLDPEGPHADERLLAALAHDLDAAFEALVVAHQDRLYTIALRMLGDPSDAEEAAQDAFVRAYRALAAYDAERILALRLRGWLATIVLNLCRTRTSRRAAVGKPALSLDADARPAMEPVAAGTAADVAERRAAIDAWSARLLRLPASYRAPVVLRHVDGMSYPEAAAALGRPEGTVKAQVHRGLGLLRAMLEAEARAEHQELTA